MNKKNILQTTIAATLCTAGFQAHASLSTGTVLDFDPGVQTCVTGGVYPDCTDDFFELSGSYFAWDSNGDGTISNAEKISISPFNGIIMGVTQASSGSHTGYPDNSETPGIDSPWVFLCNTGMHTTLSPITVANDLGATKELDFSGWGMNWNALSTSIDLGGGTQDCGTSSDGVCFDGLNDLSGIINNGSGLATITCSSAPCATNDTYTLDYMATVPLDHPSNFGGASYSLHLEGSAVPIPAAVRLFSSGFIGLMGMARRKKNT